MNKDLIPAERIENRILLLRGQKVMIDMDLAALYGVETKALKRAVKRNISRFPEDFMFVIDREEFTALRCQIGTSRRLTRGWMHHEQGFDSGGTYREQDFAAARAEGHD